MIWSHTKIWMYNKLFKLVRSIRKITILRARFWKKLFLCKSFWRIIWHSEWEVVKDNGGNLIVWTRNKMQHEEIKEEIYTQDLLFKNHIKIIHDSRNAKEENFDTMQQEEREKVRESSINPLNIKVQWIKVNEYLKFVEAQDRKMDSFVGKMKNFGKPIKRASSLWGGDTSWKSWRLRKVLQGDNKTHEINDYHLRNRYCPMEYTIGVL